MGQKAVEAHGLEWDSPQVSHICLALDIKNNVNCRDPSIGGGGGSLGKNYKQKCMSSASIPNLFILLQGRK